EYPRELADSLILLGAIDQAAGRTSEAEARYRGALEIRQRLADAHPGAVEDRRALGSDHHRLALCYQATGRASEAETAFRDTLEVRQRLADEHPRDAAQRGDLARGHHSLGALYAATGRPKE